MKRSIRVKPGKAQSTVGFAVGLVFVGIGLLVVIPTFGAFGILWTLIALGMTIYQFAMAAGKVSMGSWSIEEEGTGTESGEDGKSAQERLTELQNLYDRRLISQEEYEKKRQEILEEL